ncbi:myb-like protein P [Armigeres subalbatus]|uniref:myb-like protein P n=1 Tax=Armigeres subalbatus TaxID=124917 RepID=UPI002ED043BB
MASIIEIIKVITSLVPSYDGNPDRLNNVISSLIACKALVNAENSAAAIQTILSRLEGKARAAVTDDPLDIDDIINRLKDKCSTTATPNSILAKLNALKQRDSFEKFTQGIEKLTLELERAYLNENVPLDTATKLATGAGIKALTNGVKNDETKLLLKAGQFTALSKAVEKASENEAEKQTNVANVFPIHGRNSQRGTTSSSNSYRNNYQNNRGNFQFHRGSSQNYRGNVQNYRGNFQNYRGNFHQNRGKAHSNRGSFSRFNNRGRGYFNNSGPENRGVYYYTPGNMQVPQQIVGGQQFLPPPAQTTAIQHQHQQQNQYQIALANVQSPRH